MQRERLPALGHPHHDLQQVRRKVNEGLFENLDLISHPSGPDRCEIQVQIPESLGPETPPWGISFRSALLGDDASIQPGQLRELMLNDRSILDERASEANGAQEGVGGDSGCVSVTSQSMRRSHKRQARCKSAMQRVPRPPGRIV